MALGAAVEQALLRWRQWRNGRLPGPLGSWHREHGEERLNSGLPVRSSDIVIDGGGYRGDWTAQIASHYGCRIIVVEPVSAFYAALQRRFTGNDRVEVVHAAIGRADGKIRIYEAADGSSVFGNGSRAEIAPLRDVVGLLPSEPSEIGCMKLNIEGGEYDVLERLGEAGVLPRIRVLLIQFHQIGVESEARRRAIQEVLARTHELIFDYPFVWERWELRPSTPRVPDPASRESTRLHHS